MRTTPLTLNTPQASAPDRQAALEALKTEIAAASRRLSTITQALPDAPDSEQAALRAERTALYSDLPGLLDDLEEAARRACLADLEAMAAAHSAALAEAAALDAALSPLQQEKEALYRQKRQQETRKQRREIPEAEYQTWEREAWQPDILPIEERLEEITRQQYRARQAATVQEVRANTRYQAQLTAAAPWGGIARAYAKAVRARAQEGR